MQPKTIKCKSCRSRGVPKNNSTLGYFCEKESCQEERINQALKKVRKQTERATKESNRVWNKERKQIMEKLKTLSEYEKDAKIFFQHWIRIRDISKGYDCISCGAKITIPTADGSHYYNANQFSGLIFNETNCHASCQKCNRFEGGRLLDYRDGLITRYGAEYLAELESKKESHRNYKYTKQELIDIKNKYSKLISEFKKK